MSASFRNYGASLGTTPRSHTPLRSSTPTNQTPRDVTIGSGTWNSATAAPTLFSSYAPGGVEPIRVVNSAPISYTKTRPAMETVPPLAFNTVQYTGSPRFASANTVDGHVRPATVIHTAPLGYVHDPLASARRDSPRRGSSVHYYTDAEAKKLSVAFKNLESSNEDYRQEALLELRMRAKEDERAIKACIDRIEKDRSNWVRCLAAKTLGEVAHPHHHGAIAILTEFLKDPSEVVRIGAFQGLCMVDPVSAFKALGTLPTSKKANAVEGLIKLTESYHSVHWPWAKAKAAEVLRNVAQPGDRSAITALADVVQHADECGRINAARSLGDLAHPGDIIAIMALISCCRDNRWERGESFAIMAQVTAVEALGRVARPGDAGAIATIHACIHKSDDRVRAASFQALAAIDPAINKELATEELLKLLNDADVHVRAQAAMALECVAEPGDPMVGAAVAACANSRAFSDTLREMQGR